LEGAPRNLFYLAQEYFQNGKLAEFKPIAQAAIIMRGLGVVEEYELLMQLAQVPGTEPKKLAAEAYGLMPDRREALGLLINYAIIDGQHGRAMELAEAMIALSGPTKTYWSLNHEWYGWKADELYRQCLRLNGREKEADNDWESSVSDDAETISIIHATKGQPEKALAIRETWFSYAAKPENVEYIFIIDESDSASLNVLKGFKHTTAGEPNRLGSIVMCADDETFPEKGWDEVKPEKEKSA
jgi:hypothetical protein